MTRNRLRDLWFPTTGILMPAFASTIAIAALWLKVGTRHGGHAGLGVILIYTFGVILVAGYVAQLISMPLALLAMYKHSALRSRFPLIVLGISFLHIALGTYYFY